MTSSENASRQVGVNAAALGGVASRSDPSVADPFDPAAAPAEIARLQRALEAAAAREHVLADELQHRVRNLLAMIRSIARQTWEEGASQSEYVQHFQGRLDAIARYHRHLGAGRPSRIEVEDLIRDELLPTHVLDTPACIISGPSVQLDGKQAELFALAVHELAVNAIKFGALGQRDGVLAVTWSVDDRRLDFRWSESGVAVAGSAPRPFGFGRETIENALPYELGATTSFVLKAGGLDCSIAFLLVGADAVVAQPAPATEEVAEAPDQPEANR